MISSLNAYGGLSGAELLKLFAAPTTPSASGPAAPAPQGAGLAEPDPATSIKGILAQAHMNQAASAQSGGTFTAYVHSEYFGQEGESVAVGDNGAGGLAIQVDSHNPLTLPGETGMLAAHTSALATPTGPASDTIQFSDVLAVSNAGHTDAQGVSLGVTVAGLGTLSAADSQNFSAHALDAAHPYVERFALEVFVNDQDSQLNFSVDGLTAAQAKGLDDAIGAAATAQGIAKTAPNHTSDGIYYAAAAVDEFALDHTAD